MKHEETGSVLTPHATNVLLLVIGYTLAVGLEIQSVVAIPSTARQPRQANAADGSSVCVDVLSFIRGLNAVSKYCYNEPSRRERCYSQLKRLRGQLKIASGESRANTGTLQGILHKHNSHTSVLDNAPLISTPQQLRNVTFHLAVFCVKNPFFCRQQVASSGITLRESNAATPSQERPASSRATTKPRNRPSLSMSAWPETRRSSTDHSTVSLIHPRFWSLADHNGDKKLSAHEEEIFLLALLRLQILLAENTTFTDILEE